MSKSLLNYFSRRLDPKKQSKDVKPSHKPSLHLQEESLSNSESTKTTNIQEMTERTSNKNEEFNQLIMMIVAVKEIEHQSSSRWVHYAVEIIIIKYVL